MNAILATLVASSMAANCQAVLVKRVEAGDVMRGPITTTEPDNYLLTFKLDAGAELHGGRHGLVLVLKMCDDTTVLELSAP